MKNTQPTNSIRKAAHKLIIPTALALALVGGGVMTTRAQDTTPVVVGNIGNYQVCSTTDYASVAATALGLTATEVRVALAKGTSLDQLAQQKGITTEALQAAFEAARIAEIDQAVTDGLLTKEQADILKQFQLIGGLGKISDISILPVAPAIPVAPGDTTGAPAVAPTPAAPGSEIMIMPPTIIDIDGANIIFESHDIFGGVFGGGRRGRGGMGMDLYSNQSNPVIAAAKALDVSCPDLAKAMQTGKSIAEVAAEKNVPLQTVVDAVVGELNAAIDKDLAEGLIAAVQAEAQKADQINNALRLLSRSNDGNGRGGHPFGGGRPGGRDGGNNSGGGRPGRR
jgi:uncharacterized membrane protein YgcG